MNRGRIKFRAWNSKSKTMYYDVHIDCYGHANKDGSFITYCEEDVVTQFTGLKDKNGKDIYESDIVKINNSQYTVQWSDFKYGWINHKNADYMDYAHYDINFGDKRFDIEVIGNIFETPELSK